MDSQTSVSKDTGSGQFSLDHTQKRHFEQNGYLKLENCFSREAAACLTADIWTRLDMSPTDKSTWSKPRIHMTSRRSFRTADFAPKAWRAICEILGGADRVHPESQCWRDSFIVNLGTPSEKAQDKEVHLGRDLWDWHVDGNYFTHFLDSPEQALLVIPLFTDIRPGGGGTILCPPAIADVAKYLVRSQSCFKLSSRRLLTLIGYRGIIRKV